MKFEICFRGHENIRSLHKKTIEITKDSHLTEKGDCIIGVNADYACKDIPNKIKNKLKDPKSKVKFLIEVHDFCFEIAGKGHPDLSFTHPRDLVIRKSDFICPRTLAVSCDRASDEIPRTIVKLLQNPETRGIFSLEVH